MKQSDIVKKLRKLGYKVTIINASAMNRAGMPDILVSFNGFPVFVEIKIGNDKLTKLQEDFRDEMPGGWACLHYNKKSNLYTCEVWRSNMYAFSKQITEKLNAN